MPESLEDLNEAYYSWEHPENGRMERFDNSFLTFLKKYWGRPRDGEREKLPYVILPGILLLSLQAFALKTFRNVQSAWTTGHVRDVRKAFFYLKVIGAHYVCLAVLTGSPQYKQKKMAQCVKTVTV